MPLPGQEDFFDRMHEWSERKLQLLKKYVDAADKILGSINRIYYVDGFAGRGTYRDGANTTTVVIRGHESLDERVAGARVGGLDFDGPRAASSCETSTRPAAPRANARVRAGL